MDNVEIFVDDEDLGAILGTLEERDVSFAVTAGGPPQDDHSMVSFAVPTHGVENLFEDLEDAGLGEDEYALVSDPEFARSATEEALRDRYARTSNRFTVEALDSKVWDMRRETSTFLLLMVLSAGIATIGLLNSTPAIIVGSMVITPLLTPILSTGVGAALGDLQMIREGITSQLAGLAAAVGAAAVVASVSKHLGFVPQTLAVTDLPFVVVRLSPGALSLIVAALAGAAAAYGLANKEFVLLAGVAIAGALVPTAAAAGMGIAWGHWTLAIGATVLVLLAMLTINLSAAATLLLLDYRPDEGVDDSLPSGRRAFVAVGAVALLGLLVLGVGVGTYQQSTFESDVNEETESLFSEQAYAELDAVDVSAEYRGVGSTSRPEVVTIVVSTPADADRPSVAEPIEERLAERGYDVTVRVQYQEYHYAAD